MKSLSKYIAESLIFNKLHITIKGAEYITKDYIIDAFVSPMSNNIVIRKYEYYLDTDGDIDYDRNKLHIISKIDTTTNNLHKNKIIAVEELKKKLQELNLKY